MLNTSLECVLLGIGVMDVFNCVNLSNVCKILKRFNVENVKRLSTPLSMHVKLSKDECPHSDHEKEFMNKFPYQSTVGSLMYAIMATRPNIAFAVRAMSKFLWDLGKKHWEAVKLILRYLCGTKNKCLCLGGRNLSVIGYTYFDYARCSNSRKSTSGYIFQFMGVPYLGDVVSRNVLLSPPQKQSMLHLAKNVRKQYGYPD